MRHTDGVRVRFRMLAMASILLVAAGPSGAGDPPRIERPADGVVMIYDDTGNWGGGSMGTAHQNHPRYLVKKAIDLSGLPEGELKAAQEARLRVYFAVQDYSWNMREHVWNGLDEAFELHVNGNVHTYQTNEGFPAREKAGERLEWEWHDFIIPAAELKRGPNEFLFRKVPSEGKDDDYVYVGIDNTESHGNSQVSFDGGETWRSDVLNAIDATGEYMVRLVLISGDLRATARWRPGDPAVLDDGGKLVGYAGIEEGGARLELDAGRIDARRPVTATIGTDTGAEAKIEWADREGKPIEGIQGRDGLWQTSRIAPGVRKPSTLSITGATPTEVTIEYSRPYLPSRPVIDMCPPISPPAGRPSARPPRCELRGGQAVLENAHLRCEFGTKPRLHLRSLFGEVVAKECLADPQATRLFLLEVDGERFGAQDFVVRDVRRTDGAQGFVADLLLEAAKLAATLTATIADEPELRLALKLTNEGADPVTLKLAFPHLAGLRLSRETEDDYYLFPYFGGTIASVPTYLRTAYGENSAWWQMIDLFSPERGGGLYLRCEDTTGLFKCPALRKGTGHGEFTYTTLSGYMDPAMWWHDSLAPGTGAAMTFEYIRRTREPGESFAPPAARIGVHEGDWRVALQRYADWAHEVWKWRPTPSKLTGRWHIVAPGWGQSPLFQDGAYRTDYLTENADVAELMSYWEWSDLGPWRVPMSHETLPQDLGEALYTRYKAYWVVNPATGKLQYPINRGDYEYNETWGGLPALRECISKIKQSGTVATYYVESILACDTTKVGHEYGPIYGVKNPLWKDAYNCPLNPEGYVASYGSYNMCADNEWWPEYLAKTVQRLCRDTGVEGVRLDEYGHRGFVCHNDRHQHLFAEPGHNAWLQAVSRACRLVHEAMDEVAPDLVLMTEFPGLDQMAAHLEGAIVYETRAHIGPFRPVPCNLFRFYFPECKVFDLCHDRGLRDDDFKLWNASGAFGGLYPDSYYRILKENSDAFDGQQLEPLIPTLKRRIYANRFTAGEKSITMLCNASDFTYDGPVLELEDGDDRRYFDLLNCRKLTPVTQDGRRVLSLKLARDGIACVVALPKLLRLEGTGERLRADVTAPGDGLTLVLAATDGARLAEWPARTGRNELRVEPPAEGPRPACLKLMKSGYLADAAEVPR